MGLSVFTQMRAVCMKIIENDTSGGFGQSPNLLAEEQNPTAEETKHIGLYQKCLNCQDYGVTCNGPKLAALGDIMVVREFHRAIKAARKITLKDVAAAAPTISEYTVNDYFSHSVKDFKWTTVGVIDNALTAICGNRVGQPLLDNPCPASSSEIISQMDDLRDQLEAANLECERLREKNTQKDEKYIEQMAIQRKTHTETLESKERSITYLRTQAERLQKDIDEERLQSADYLKRIDDKNALLEVRQEEINRLNGIILEITREHDRERRNLNIQKGIIVLLLVAVLIALTCYLVWDLMHPGVGLFQW